jgi:CMP/dCMP kinase
MIVAIDGPAGAGKSTVARAVARALGFRHLDTGAMYRALALAGDRDPATVDVAFSPEGRVLLDGRDVEDEARRPETGRAASVRAVDPDARAAMRARQGALMAEGDWVAEGRDIGTVVAPDADVKVWLTASLQERARRRGVSPSEVAERDERDASREHAPMLRAADAVELDTTGLAIDEVVERIVALARDRGAVAR